MTALFAWLSISSASASYNGLLLSDPVRDSASILFARGKVHRIAKEQSESLAALRAAASLLQRGGRPENDTLLAEVLVETGRVFGEICEYDSAETCQNRALALRSRIFGPTSGPVAEVLYYIGGIRAGKSDALGSIEIRQRALKMLEGDTAQAALAVRFCDALALLHAGRGDLTRARFYFDHGFALLGTPPRDTFLMAHLLDDDAHVCLAPNGQWAEAFRNTRRAEQLMTGKNNAQWQINHHEVVGNLFWAHGQPDSALVFHRLQFSGLMRQPRPSPTVVAHTMQRIASDFWQMHEPDSCLSWLKKSWDIELKIFGPQFGMFYSGYRIAGDCYLAKKDTAEAEQFYSKSLSVNNFEERIVAKLHNPGAGFLSLAALGELHFRQGKLAESLQDFAAADSAALLWRTEMRESDSRERLSESARPMYENGIEAAWQLYQKTGDSALQRLAFRFAERCKSIELSDAVRAVDARLRAGVPDSLRRLEDSLARETHSADQIRRRKGISDALASRLENKYWLFKHHLEVLRDTLDRRFGLFAENKLRNELADPDTLPDYCRRTGSAVLSFFVGKERLHSFVAHANGVVWLTQPISAGQLADRVGPMRTAISVPPEDLTDEQAKTYPKMYAEAARWLCRELFEPAERIFPSGIGRVVVVPDGCLSLLPFEVLLKKMPAEPANFQSHEYLLRQFSFGYAPSVTLLGQMERREIHPSKLFLGIAPLFSDSLPPLKTAGRGASGGILSRKEIEFPLHYFNGDSLIGLAASKEQFLAVCQLYRVLHFVTHGHADATDPSASWLMMFSADGDFLRPGEVAGLRLNAALVFLNACETGAGPVSPVEGVQSMARAFALAGAKSIVATGWRVDDAVAVRMSDEFYHAVFSGKTKDAALAEAKRRVLADPSLAHPFFWGGYAVWGDRTRLFF